MSYADPYVNFILDDMPPVRTSMKNNAGGTVVYDETVTLYHRYVVRKRARVVCVCVCVFCVCVCAKEAERRRVSECVCVLCVCVCVSVFVYEFL